MNIDRAWRWGEALFGLGKVVYQAIQSGKTERLSDILPDELLISIERKRAELEAELHFRAKA